ncbi:hypothetical protein SAMD00019534_075170 [Acytostelium subglobosum LB1]|uniref:hypothetical protein n=1 Tax=Acytostelium subglobosum LB1 TaxID=1410327 RepID=UPI000644D9C7|nr:hypothetical protein SAMD00019534_075170 [Acytostelium subglobosum LB1]GAM24342.1 hypothetical protein SAMD00019534_075170 [Acytostelium subglobosum LB1]|eukprot:XP_012752668.1 hypothetical protein SAMD00019534_075170 [Acytostelium subglobosum LB1]
MLSKGATNITRSFIRTCIGGQHHQHQQQHGFYSSSSSSSSSSNDSHNNNNNTNNDNTKNGNGWWNRIKTPLIVGGVITGTLTATATLMALDDVKTAPKPLDVHHLLKPCDNGKERIVVLGTGWASLAFIKGIDLDKFEIVVVSPRNYFLFTPMLTASTVGSVEVRSISEPIRRILNRLSKKNTFYIEAECTLIDPNTNTVTLKDIGHLLSLDKAANMVDMVQIPYDKLVIAVGSAPNTMGTSGVKENCYFLKDAKDAIIIRGGIMDCFERASFPNQTEQQKRDRLHFAIVGGGPTGVEFAGEIHDYIYDDLSKIFPELMKYCKISLIQSADHLLNTYDKSIIDYTEKHFGRSNIATLFSSRVTCVDPNKLTVVSKAEKKNVELPFGMCVWATGVGPTALTANFCNSIEEQRNNRAISTDTYFKVIGVPQQNIYAIGDCATVTQQKLLDHLGDLFKEADENGDDKLSIDELIHLVKNNTKKYPQLEAFVSVLPEKFAECDANKDNFLQFEEFQRLVAQIDANLTTLPATAQVANQAGKYLATSLNDFARTKDPSVIVPFRYRHLGSFAYIGHHSAVADIPNMFAGGGFGVWWAWRAIYLEKQFSWKNQTLVSLDWFKTIMFGRDISRL